MSRTYEEEQNFLIEEIKKIKKRMGKKLLILTHHYQRPEIVNVGDFRGDSFKLSRLAAEEVEAENIVFCGVHFMAESARILAREEQRVFHPDLNAGCPMADMADPVDVEIALKKLSALFSKKNIIPISYINTNADVKAITGMWDGSICTSSNAEVVFKWAFEKNKKILFLPDEFLGRNTAKKMGFKDEEMLVYDPTVGIDELAKKNIERIKIFLWKGYCHVHTWFRKEHVIEARKRFPHGKIIVHPECTEDVCSLADEIGSTEKIAKYVESFPPHSTIIIGTEINLISRLARENPQKNIIELHRSLCPNMYKITLRKLFETIKKFPEEKEIIIEKGKKQQAKQALKRMLDLV